MPRHEVIEIVLNMIGFIPDGKAVLICFIRNRGCMQTEFLI
jgi:hypothetical protein